jgi:hypothetical protein
MDKWSVEEVQTVGDEKTDNASVWEYFWNQLSYGIPTESIASMISTLSTISTISTT